MKLYRSEEWAIMKCFKRVLFCLAAVMAVPMLFAADPTISLTATPRYPWNGLVDIDFTLTGEETDGGYAVYEPGDDAIAGHRLKYVQSAGDVQLNTGVVPGSKNTIELKFAWDDNPEKVNECLFCARGSTTTTATFTGFLINSRWRFDYNSTTGSTNGVPQATKGVPIVVRDVAGTASVDGITRQSYSATSFTVGGPLTLFASYVGAPGTSTDNHLKGKIYYLKIFGDDGTTLLHDFVPWEKDGVVGMYDMIAARFVAPNVGTLTCGTRGPKYDTSFTARDVAGGTNLTMKTLYKSNGAAANPAKESLPPGTYNWVWDAGEDLTRRWETYSGCIPTSGTVLFPNAQLNELTDFYAVPCGLSVSDKSNLAKGAHIKDDGAGKSVQFAFSDDVYTKCVCVHLEQSGANVVGYAKWARYVTGTGHEESDFDSNSATELGIATSETERGYGLLKLQAKGAKINDAKVVEQVVVDGNIAVSAFLYTVKFNANGGTGTMADEPLAYGIEKALTANAFTRTGYTFQGWATSASGGVVYSDKQSVSNLTTSAGATVNLYAVWKASGGVQLWANGPYWAECNVGATKPEQYGYYFWWGDTKGYKRVGSSWNAVDGSKTGFAFKSTSSPTYGKNLSQLQNAGYIDASGNLVAKYDAASVHMGAPWRMPTEMEISGLVSNCTITKTTRNGINGNLFTGKGKYSSKSIFLPASGIGGSSSPTSLDYCGAQTHYWSSTAYSGNSTSVWVLTYAYDLTAWVNCIYRYYGCTVRPVR